MANDDVHVQIALHSPRSEASSVLDMDEPVGASDVSMPMVKPSRPSSIHTSSSSDSELAFDESVTLYQPGELAPNANAAFVDLVDKCIDKFPSGRITDYDNTTLSCGLFVHHKLSGPSDVFGRPVRTKLELPASGTHIDLNLITAWTLKQLLRYPDLREAQSIVQSSLAAYISLPH
jgi:hypothetical protein